MHTPSSGVVRILLVTALALVTGCGPTEFRAQLGGAWQSFGDLKTTLTRTADGLQMTTCGLDDPIPNAVDDEKSLCLSLVLDEGQLSGPGNFTIEGTATFAQAHRLDTLQYTAAPAQAALVRSGWVQLTAFCMPNEAGVSQQLRGTLTLQTVKANTLEGRVNLGVEGSLAGSACYRESGPSEFDYAFRVARP